jgi:hypothetical protein
MDMIRYTLTPGTRFAEKTGITYDVEEIRVDGVLVGAMHTGDNYRFGEVTDAAGSYPHGDCVLDTADSRDVMVGMIMRHRVVGNREDWRTLAAHIERDDAERVA